MTIPIIARPLQQIAGPFGLQQILALLKVTWQKSELNTRVGTLSFQKGCCPAAFPLTEYEMLLMRCADMFESPTPQQRRLESERGEGFHGAQTKRIRGALMDQDRTGRRW